jgi:hypothetical protein
MSKFEENLKTMINCLVDGFKKDLVARNEDSILKLAKVYEEDPKRYLKTIILALHEFNELIVTPFNVKDSKNQYITRYVVNGLYEEFFNRYMEKNEGSSCCADKSRFIQSTTLEALTTGENKSLYESYQGYERIPKEDWDKQAYWSPKTIKDTNEAMKIFWDWYLLR